MVRLTFEFYKQPWSNRYCDRIKEKHEKEKGDIASSKFKVLGLMYYILRAFVGYQEYMMYEWYDSDSFWATNPETSPLNKLNQFSVREYIGRAKVQVINNCSMIKSIFL